MQLKIPHQKNKVKVSLFCLWMVQCSNWGIVEEKHLSLNRNYITYFLICSWNRYKLCGNFAGPISWQTTFLSGPMHSKWRSRSHQQFRVLFQDAGCKDGKFLSLFQLIKRFREKIDADYILLHFSLLVSAAYLLVAPGILN